jgi:hypothetical protein
MPLPDVMSFNLEEAELWERRLRKVAEELEKRGDEAGAKMMYAAAALMCDKVRQLRQKKNPSPNFKN